MDWKSETNMDQKISFIRERESGQYYFNSLCEAYGISRTAGYALIERYQAEGLSCVEPRSLLLLLSPSSCEGCVVRLVIKCLKLTVWGAKKIRV